MADSLTPQPLYSPPGPYFAKYFWVIVKNLVGWLLILLSLPVAVSVPVPLATPMFLIGFALITFPGKRRLTSRVLSGKQIDLNSRWLRMGALGMAFVLPPLVVWLFARRQHSIFHFSRIGLAGTIALYCMAIAGAWLLIREMLRGTNLVLRFLPRIRRRIRPWLHRHGIQLLPPRNKRLTRWAPRPPANEEILGIDQSRMLQEQQKWTSRFFRGRTKHILGVVITLAIFVWMFKPILKRWPDVRDRVMDTSLPRFLLAAGMFSIFLFVFRVISWRKILAAFGHKLPLAATTRIWSTSELARYLPGVIWQVVGRVYLVRPYGIKAAVCSTSQILELAIFLLSNLLVALACLPWYGARLFGHAHWLWAATALAPLLLLLLRPRIFYGGINSILLRLGKKPLESRLSSAGLLALVGWAILGLIWQGLAIWLLLNQAHMLNLPFQQLGLLVGAYCLAWCAGFLAFWTPGGIGVREGVLVLTLQFALPIELRNQFISGGSEKLFLSFLSILLRLWTLVGELILSSLSYAFDYRGAMGRADAPGRVKEGATLSAETF